MPGLFDNISAYLDEQKPSEKPTPFFQHLSQELDNETIGVTPASLFNLPPKQKKLMLTLMRDTTAVVRGINLKELREQHPELDDDLPATLENLVNDGWLIALGEAGRISYRVHFGRKPGSKLGFGIWSMLSTRLQQDKS